MVVWWCFPHIFQVSYSLACLLWFCGAKTVAPGPSWSHNLTINQPMVSGFMRSFVSNIAFRSQWFVATDWIETKNPGSFLLWRFTRASKRLCFFLWTAKDWQCTCVCLVEFEIIWVFVPQVYVHTHKLETYEYTPVMCRYTYNVSIYTQHTHIYIHTHVYIQSLHMSSVYIYTEACLCLSFKVSFQDTLTFWDHLLKELSVNMTKEMDVCWYFMQRRAPELQRRVSCCCLTYLVWGGWSPDSNILSLKYWGISFKILLTIGFKLL